MDRTESRGPNEDSRELQSECKEKLNLFFKQAQELFEHGKSPSASSDSDKDSIKNYSDQLEASLGFPRFWTSSSEEQHQLAAEIIKKELALNADLAIEDLAGRMNNYRRQIFGGTMYEELWSSFFRVASPENKERMEIFSSRWTGSRGSQNSNQHSFMGDYLGRSIGEPGLRRYSPSYQFFNPKD